MEEAFAVHDYVGGGTEPKGTRAIELVPEVTPSQFLEVYRATRQPGQHALA